jgi:hypothetical protein
MKKASLGSAAPPRCSRFVVFHSEVHRDETSAALAERPTLRGFCRVAILLTGIYCSFVLVEPRPQRSCIMQWTKVFLLLAGVTECAAAQIAPTPSSKEIEAVWPDAYALYTNLHQRPELSGHETQTAARLASWLRTLSYDVTETSSMRLGPKPSRNMPQSGKRDVQPRSYYFAS